MEVELSPQVHLFWLLILLLTTENLPSPNHMTQRVPSAARLRPLIHQETILPGHHEKPRSFPNTSVPMPKPRPSCREERENELISQFDFLKKKRKYHKCAEEKEENRDTSIKLILSLWISDTSLIGPHLW